MRRGAGAPPDNFGRGTWGVLSRSLLCRVLSSWLFLEKNLSICPYIVHPTTFLTFLLIFICQPLLKITVAPTIFVCKCWSLQLSMGLPLLSLISVKIGPLYRRCSWELDYTKETEESASIIFAANKTAKQQFWRQKFMLTFADRVTSLFLRTWKYEVKKEKCKTGVDAKWSNRCKQGQPNFSLPFSLRGNGTLSDF